MTIVTSISAHPVRDSFIHPGCSAKIVFEAERVTQYTDESKAICWEFSAVEQGTQPPHGGPESCPLLLVKLQATLMDGVSSLAGKLNNSSSKSQWGDI